MKISVFSLGCKTNQYEGRKMAELFGDCGISACEGLTAADCYVINTCAVTAEADRKSRQAVSRVLALNPAAKVYVCGCSAARNAENFYGKPNVISVCAESANKTEFAKKIIADILDGGAENLTLCGGKAPSAIGGVDGETGGEFGLVGGEKLPYGGLGAEPPAPKTRGFIKIQDGCDKFCSYCIVPHLRGRSRSRPVAEIVAEAKELAKTTKEIVFTGIDISAFGRERGEGLITLVRALGAADVRKRLGSLECGVIDGDFLRALTDSGFCDHLHLSMQSGSDGVLRRMNRRYTAAEFIRKTQQIRDFMPDCGIMSDIICGFPGETDAEFNETLQTLEQIRFGGVHVFVYSERDGTAAAKMPQLPKSVRRERAKIVSELTERHKREFLTSQLGKVKDVYVEENGGAFNTGYTSNYIKVYTRAPLKSMTPHKLNEIYKEGVKGHYE